MEKTGDGLVDAALAQIARRDLGQARAASAAFGSLSMDEGLQAITLFQLQDWLWYQLPAKWVCDLVEQLQLAAALGALFAELDMPRYAAVCTSDTTTRVLAAWDHGAGYGLKALAKAMDASGIQPPDIDGVIAWGDVTGMQETSALLAAATRLEMAIAAGELTPGARGWRPAAQTITRQFLTAPSHDLGSGCWLEAIHAERLDRWATSRGGLRERLTTTLATTIAQPAPLPADAADRLAPLSWLLAKADPQTPDGGVPLTVNHTLARAVVAEACRHFDWLTTTGNPRSEADLPEAWTLREMTRDLGALRRQKRRLVLTPTGRELAADTTALWRAATAALIPADNQAEAAAAEIALMLYLTAAPTGYSEFNTAVADTMAAEGWHNPTTAAPIDPGSVGWLVGALHRRMNLLGLLHKHRPLGTADRLTETGHAAAHQALHTHALCPRTDIGSG